MNIVRSAPFKAVNFYCFTVFKRLFLGDDDENTESSGVMRFAAGALAGVTATLTCFPLDTIRTRMLLPGHHAGFAATVSTMARQGLSTFYLGCIPAIISTAPAGAVYYGVYDLLKNAQLKRENGDLEAQGLRATGRLHWLQVVAFGSVASAASELVAFPFEVVRRNMQVAGARAPFHALGSLDECQGGHRLTSSVRVVVSILRRKGVGGLYAGIGPSLLQVLPSGASTYLTYEFVKQLLGLTD